MNKM